MRQNDSVGRVQTLETRRGARRTANFLLFAVCCIADAFVLRTAWTGREIAPGQFRRGYFETFDGSVGLAVDDAIRTGMVPTFLATDGGDVAVPPGMTAVAPIAPDVEYVLTSDRPIAAYAVIGVEAAVAPAEKRLGLSPGEARLVGGRTLSLQDGRLALVAWDPMRPWREDAVRLTSLFDGCIGHGDRAALTIGASAGQLEIRLGHCALVESLRSPPAATTLVAAIAGPEWMTIGRRPVWKADRWIVWPVLAAVVGRVATIWWAFGPASAAATSAVLAGAAIPMPVPAMLTWPLMLVIGVVAAAVRAALIVTRRPARRRRAPIALAVLAVAGCAITVYVTRGRPSPWIAYGERARDITCPVIGYSTVKGEGLRHESGGIRSLLNEDCPPCRNKTAGVFAGGETLAWMKDAFCRTPDAFGSGGQVVFLGGVNDDYFWGVAGLPRLFIAGQQGSEQWRRNEVSAAAASLYRIDAQASALEELIRCASSRGARFLFLHDFLVTDMVSGRTPDRAAMLEHRRAAVEGAGGRFVDLLQVFSAEAGVAWFNDYVHLSRVAHRRVADLACAQSF
jgi:hypothetical protein